jgi:hypothetical protein
MLVIAWPLGIALLAALRLRATDRLERVLFSLGLGLWALEYLPMLLGAFGKLTPANIRVLWVFLLAAALLLGAWRVVAPFRQARAMPATFGDGSILVRLPVWDTPRRSRTILIASAACLIVAGVVILSVSFEPGLDFDGLVYHVAVPWRWLMHGSMRRLPTLLYSEWPMGSEILYTLLLPVGGAGACKPLVALMALISAAAVCALGRRWLGWTAGLLAAALYFRLLLRLYAIDTTSVETALTLATTLSALALTLGYHEEADGQRLRWLALSAIFAGWACCIKLSGLQSMLVLAIVAAALDDRKPAEAVGSAWSDPIGPRWNYIRSAGAFCMFILIALACAAPWYLRSLAHTGNPIFPFGFGLFGGRGWSAHSAAVLSASLQTFEVPGATFAARHAFVVRHVAVLAVCVAALAVLPIPRTARFVLISAGAFLVVQTWASYQQRFMLPGLTIACVIIACCIARLTARWPIAMWPCALLLLGSFANVTRHRIQEVRAFAIDHQAPPGAADVAGLLGAYSWANRHLPADARVLLGPDDRNFSLKRDVFMSHSVLQQEIPMATESSFRSALAREGIRYFIFARQPYSMAPTQFELAAGWRTAERDRLAELAQHSRPLAQFPDVDIYAIEPIRTSEGAAGPAGN